MRRLALALLLATVGCRSFDIKTPPNMIELEHDASFEYRAMTPEGVVLGVRVIDQGDKRADVPFWARAIALHMKELSGYALLQTSEVTTRDGVKGTELRFGHDEHGKPYAYIVRIYVVGKRLFLVEAGGTKDEVEKAKADIDWAMTSLSLH